MKNRIYGLLSIVLSVVMLASSVPTISYAVEIDDEIADEEIVEADEEIVVEEQADVLIEDGEEVESEFEEDDIEDSVNELYEEEELNEEIEEYNLTDLDKELIAEGATIPNLGCIEVDDYVPDSLSENTKYTMLYASYEPEYNPLRDADYLPNTRSQSPYGTCWAHSTIACNEINAIMNGEASRSLDLSEAHLVTALRDSAVDPLDLSHDVSRYIGKKRILSNTLEGGNQRYTVHPLLCWQGLAYDEGEFSYSNIGNRAGTSLTTEEAYGNTEYTTQGYARINMKRRSDIKAAIKEYGAVSINYHSEDTYSPYYNGSNNLASYYCYDDNMEINHAIVVVGWDDNYSKDNFKVAPAGNGAWLVRNSWSRTNSKEYSLYTYFWLSYYDKSIDDEGFAFKCESAGKYDNNYFYDRTFTTNFISGPSGAKIANVFKAKAWDNGEYIKAVGFETGNSNVNYEVQIYKNLTDSKVPNSGTLVATKSGRTTFEGYTTVELDEPVFVSKGDEFSAVITYSLDTGGRVLVPGEEDLVINDWLESIGESKTTESFASSDGITWKSTGEGGNLRIKVYTTNNLDTPVHTITYHVDDELLDSSFNLTYKENEFYRIPSLSKDGYTFEGWYKTEDLNENSKINNTKNENTDLDLYPKWSTNTYYMSYRANDGQIPEKHRNVWTRRTCGVPFNLDGNTFTRAGYYFTGWNTKADGTGESFDDRALCDFYVENESEVYLYAQWEEKPLRTVNFDSAGGEFVPDTIEVQFEEPYPVLPTTTMLGYEFVGWYTEGGKKVYKGAYCSMDEDHTLIAHWTPIEYKINLEADGGECEEYVMAPYDSYLLNYLPVPEKFGEIFVGWYTQAEGGVEITGDVKVDFTAPITLYAKYRSKYTVEIQFVDEATEEGTGSAGGSAAKIVGYGSHVDIISNTYGANIYYTTDGSEPTPNNLSGGKDGTHLYEEPIVITEDVTIKAIATKVGYNPSDIFSQSYMVKSESGDWGDIIPKDRAGFDSADKVPKALWVRGIEDKEYTGKAVTQTDFRVYNGKILLIPNVNYTVRYSNNTKVSEKTKATITIAGKGDYAGAIVKEFGITPLDISGAFVSDVYLSHTGDIQYAKPQVTYELGGKSVILKENKDYYLEYSDSKPNAYTDEGEYAVTVYGMGTYTGETSFSEIISKKTLITKATISRIQNQKFTGEDIEPEVTVSIGKNPLRKDVDYTITFSPDHRNVGTAQIIITGIGDYAGIKTVNFNIVGTALSSVKFEPEVTKQKEWTGNRMYGAPVKPSGSLYVINGKNKDYLKGITRESYESLQHDNDPLVNYYDFIFEYLGDQISVGTQEILFTGINGYTGTVKKSFKITGTAVSSLGVDFADKITTFYYNGQDDEDNKRSIRPDEKAGFRVYKKATKDAPEKELIKSTDGKKGDYVVTYEKNTQAGTANLIITGINGYTGTVKKPFKIVPFDIAVNEGHRFVVKDITGTLYEKGGSKPQPEVTFDGKPLTLGTDYTLSYLNNTKTGVSSTVKVTGKGNFKGVISKQFTVAAKPLSDSSITYTANDIVYQNKANILKPNIKLIDSNGKALVAGMDYSKEIEYTYAKDTVVTHLSKTEGFVEVKRLASERVDEKNDIIPKDTEINALITGIGCYEGTKTVTFRYVTADVSKATVKIEPQQYTGKPVILSKDDISVSIGKNNLAKKDYRIVSYAKNTAKGTAQVTIEGLGDYGGRKTANFTITTRNMSYKVIYHPNSSEATGKMASTFTTANAKVANCAFKRTGYAFMGWSQTPEGEVIIKNAGPLKVGDLDIYGTNIELYAIWERK